MDQQDFLSPLFEDRAFRLHSSFDNPNVMIVKSGDQQRANDFNSEIDLSSEHL